MRDFSTLGCSKSFEKTTKNVSPPRKLIDYLLLFLIFMFFAVPITGISIHYYKFGIPSRLNGLISYLAMLVKELLG
ncbi:MAG: hypothetical protein ACPL5I_10725 [Thermodesulfobacteriota bacterium]